MRSCLTSVLARMPITSLGTRSIASQASSIARAHSRSPSRSEMPMSAKTTGFGNGTLGLPRAFARKPANAARARGRPPCRALGSSGRQ
eukprot:3488955-Lingulodinium_polyedra.AAC.1